MRGRETDRKVGPPPAISDRRESKVLRVLAIGVAIALVVFALTAGHVIFLPLLFIPFGLFSFGHRQNSRRRGWW
jgi:hypothetical protein